MPDDIDRAQEAADLFQQDALAAHLRKVPQGESLAECIDCDEPIPEARRWAVPGCRRCIDCQTMREHWRAL